MGLTGKYQFRKSLWGKIVLRVEEEVKPLWSKSGALKQRWRDATLMDLAAPEMRPLIDMRFKPHLWARSFAPEATGTDHERAEAQGELGAGASLQNGEVRRIEH